jgi:hypothetical protein
MTALEKRSAYRQLVDVQSQPNGAYCGRVEFDCGRGLEQMPRANDNRFRSRPLAIQALPTYIARTVATLRRDSAALDAARFAKACWSNSTARPSATNLAAAAIPLTEGEETWAEET